MAIDRDVVRARDWLRGLLDQIARLAVNDARRLGTDHDVAVHALRVRMKKLNALLRLAADKPKRGATGEVTKAARAIKDGMAGLRDVHVLQRMAAKLGGGPLPVLPWIATPAWSATKAQRKCRELAAAVRRLPMRGTTWKDIDRRYARDLKRARSSSRECSECHDAEAFHRWRKRVKAHYFQCVALHGHREHPHRVRRLRKLASGLGHEHDLTMVNERIDDHSPAASAAHERIEEKRLKLHHDLRQLGKKVFGKEE